MAVNYFHSTTYARRVLKKKVLIVAVAFLALLVLAVLSWLGVITSW